MVSFDDDPDAGAGSNDEFDNEDEEMEDADQDQDQDQSHDYDAADDDEEEDNDDNDGDNDDDEDDDQNEPESPSRRASEHISAHRLPAENGRPMPDVTLTSPSPHASAVRSPVGTVRSAFIPPTRAEALTARAYDIVPTMAAPQSTSINAITSTPDMRYVFSGGSDGYVRMYNWVETANGKVPLTVAQKHPFVDSVMKAGSLTTYWENEEPSIKTPPSGPDEGKWTSPVYSLAVHHQALWLLSGLESGGINVQTCRHQAGTRITTLRDHTSAVSVLQLSRDETSVLSGSWDKTILDWDLQYGTVKRRFENISGQVSTIQLRPTSDVSIPEVKESVHESLDTFSSNNADKPRTNGAYLNGTDRRESKGGDEDAMGSPSSLFGEDHGSLFGEESGGAGVATNAFADDDELTRALTDGLQEPDQDAPIPEDAEMTEVGGGGPVQSPKPSEDPIVAEDTTAVDERQSQEKTKEELTEDVTASANTSTPTEALTNGLPHSDEPLTAPPTDTSSSKTISAAELPPQSESTFLDASFDGSLRIWDRRVPDPIAVITPYGGTPPWCTSACWSPDGNFIYAGRRNCTVDEFSIHKMGTNRNKPERTFRFQQGSGAVYALKTMPNGRHLVW